MHDHNMLRLNELVAWYASLYHLLRPLTNESWHRYTQICFPFQICKGYDFNYKNMKFYTALDGLDNRDNQRAKCLAIKQSLPMLETLDDLFFFATKLNKGLFQYSFTDISGGISVELRRKGAGN